MGYPPFEDVSPIKNGGFPLLCYFNQRVTIGVDAQSLAHPSSVKAPVRAGIIMSCLRMLHCGVSPEKTPENVAVGLSLFLF